MEDNQKQDQVITNEEQDTNSETEKADSKEQTLLKEINDKYLRTLAELENTRKRSASDAENAARNRARSTAELFLPLVDAIDTAIIHSPDDQGIQALKKASDNTLTKLGIIRIETVGQLLNPQFHNAIMIEDSDLPANTIVREMQSGFMFGDMVLRTAMVAVAKEKALKEKKDDI